MVWKSPVVGDKMEMYLLKVC